MHVILQKPVGHEEIRDGGVQDGGYLCAELISRVLTCTHHNPSEMSTFM